MQKVTVNSLSFSALLFIGGSAHCLTREAKSRAIWGERLIFCKKKSHRFRYQ